MKCDVHLVTLRLSAIRPGVWDLARREETEKKKGKKVAQRSSHSRFLGSGGGAPAIEGPQSTKYSGQTPNRPLERLAQHVTRPTRSSNCDQCARKDKWGPHKRGLDFENSRATVAVVRSIFLPPRLHPPQHRPASDPTTATMLIPKADRKKIHEVRIIISPAREENCTP